MTEITEGGIKLSNYREIRPLVKKIEKAQGGTTRERRLTRRAAALMALHMQPLVKEAQEASLTDHLTGLLNKRAFDQSLERAHSSSQRNGNSFSILYLDLDDFKPINDNYGHDAGDKALIAYSELLNESIRGSDYVFRLGGDEMAIILSDTPTPAALKAAEKIRSAVELKLLGRISHFASEINEPLTVSIGCTGFNPNYPQTIQELKKEADDALYGSKKGTNGNKGKNQVTLFSSSLSEIEHESTITPTES